MKYTHIFKPFFLRIIIGNIRKKTEKRKYNKTQKKFSFFFKYFFFHKLKQIRSFKVNYV